MKKKILTLGMASLLLASTFIQPTTVDANQIGVIVNGQRVHFADQPPVILNARVLVPARGTFEAMGFDVTWNDAERQSVLTRANDVIIFTMDSTIFTVNGVYHTLDVPAQLVNRRAMLPIRAVLENFGYYLGWDGATDTVIITGTASAQQPLTQQPPAQQPAATTPSAQQPPAAAPPATTLPAQQPPATTPPAQQPPEIIEIPPAEQLQIWASWFGMSADGLLEYALRSGDTINDIILALNVSSEEFWRVVSYVSSSR